MAKADIQMPDEFLEKISRLGKEFDSVAESVLEAGGEVVLEKARGNLSGAVGRGTKYKSRSTGELKASMGLSPARLNKDGNHDIKVGFAEPRSDGVSNAKLATILEYGKHGQPAKPFMKPAKTATKSAAISAMQQKFEEEVEKR
jgi:HK97 gp10 family phage protein